MRKSPDRACLLQFKRTKPPRNRARYIFIHYYFFHTLHTIIRFVSADVLSAHQKTLIRWPVYAITGFVGLFVVIVTTLWLYGHLVQGEVIDQTAWIILGASIIRLLTIIIALASIQKWGEKIATWVILGGLSRAASAQLAYPIAELIVKLIILAGLLDYPAIGVGNMTPTGWFNLAAVWFIFGLPGVWFAQAARNYQTRKGLSNTWLWLGSLLGIVALISIGLLIG